MKRQPQVLPDITHHFSKDVYARTMHMKKDSLVVGKIHKHENLNILSEGEVTVFSVDGRQTFKAPHIFVATPGAKRVIVAHSDVVWTTIHGTAEKDLEKIEKQFIAEDYSEVHGIDEDELKLIQEAFYELGNNRDGSSRLSHQHDESESSGEEQSATS